MTRTTRTSQHDPWLTPAELAEELSVPRRTLNHWRYQGTGPEYVALTAQTIRYRRSAVDRWIAEQQQQNQAA